MVYKNISVRTIEVHGRTVKSGETIDTDKYINTPEFIKVQKPLVKKQRRSKAEPTTPVLTVEDIDFINPINTELPAEKAESEILNGSDSNQ